MDEGKPVALAGAQKVFEELCGSSLENGSLLWNTSILEPAECLKHTILQWLPCGFFWLALPFYLAYLCGSRNPVGRCSAINVAKCILCMLAALCVSTDIVSYFVWKSEMPTAFLASSFVSASTMIFAGLLTVFYKRRGHMTSGIMWCYWLFWLISTFLMTYSKVRDAIMDLNVDREELTAFISAVSLAMLSFVQFILACFSDASQTEAALLEKSSPEHMSSFTSFFTFHWLGSLMVVARRQRIEESDLIGLPPRDRLANHVPYFLESLQKASDTRNRRILAGHRLDNMDSVGANERTPLLSTSLDKKSKRSPKSKTGEDGTARAFVDKPSLPLVKIIWQCYKKLILAAFLWKFLHDLLKFLDPLLQRLLIQFIAAEKRGEQAQAQSMWKGYVIASAFLVTQLLQTVFSQQLWHLGAVAGIQIRAALTAAVQRKALTLNTNDAKESFPPQEIFNLINVDIPKIQEAVKYLWIVWSTPLLVGLAMWQLYEVIGHGAFVGLATAIVSMPLMGLVAGKQRTLQAKRVLLRTERNRLTKEALGGLKVLKLYAWEPSFEGRIQVLRTEEVTILKKIWWIRTVQIGLWALSSLAMTVIMFIVKTLWSPKDVLLPEEAFVVLSLFNIIKAPLNVLPITVPYLSTALISLKRLALYFEVPDLESDRVQHELLASALSIQGGTFASTPGAQPILNSVNLDIAQHSMAAIVGKPGYGKTSLIAACIGDLHRVSGCVNVNGTVAYVGQTAWILSGTIRDNILFGKSYDERFYKSVVEACQLETELKLLEHNDMTPVGETGVGLTAAQKQLVSLARAVYADLDIYLIDNIFASIGADVSQLLYEKVLSSRGILKSKTRVVVVQGIHWLPSVDSIVVMNCGGVSEIGSYAKLASKDGPFTQYLKAYFLSDENVTTSNEIMEMQAEMLQHLVNVLGQNEIPGIKGKSHCNSTLSPQWKDKESSDHSYSSYIIAKGATTESDSACQSWRWTSQPKKGTSADLDEYPSGWTAEARSACRMYFGAVGSMLFGISIIFLILHFVAMALGDVWLGMWTADSLLPNTTVQSDEKSERLGVYIYVYVCLGVAQVAFIVAFCCLFAIGMTKASSKLYKDLLHSVMSATVSYIDSTPFATILRCFSVNVDTLDDNLGYITFQALQTALLTLTTIGVMAYSIPAFLPAVVPVGCAVYTAQVFFEPAARQFRRLEANTKLAIDTHFSDLVSGTSVIRAYRCERMYDEILSQRIEKHSAAHYVGLVAGRWLALRLEMAGAFVVAGAAAVAVVSLQCGLHTSASLVGLAVTYALNVSTYLQFLVRNNADLRDHVQCIKKIKECTYIPREPRGISSALPSCSVRRGDGTAETALHSAGMANVSPTWPQQGVVELRGYSARHTSVPPKMDFVGVSAFIKSGEKLGVIHRRGSTIVLPVFRLIEPLSGMIVIDGVDITKVASHHLRRRLTIIAQDPVIFYGSVQYNVDPCNEFSDDLIWNALERSRLKKLVMALPGQLQYMCNGDGLSFSVGQRRLLGIARAILRKTRVVFLLDDPSAGDQATDALVKRIVQQEFNDCTVITVTQRLHSTMSCDRILIMEDGCIVESGSPEALQKKTSGAFYEMAGGDGM